MIGLSAARALREDGFAVTVYEQHRLVNSAVAHLLGPGLPIHALKIKTEVAQ